MSISTHVLDSVLGCPAVGVPVRLEGPGGSVAAAVTDADGRVGDLATSTAAGEYRLRFDTRKYFDDAGCETFYPEVVVTFTIADPAQHYHVPLLLSPFAYSTYRGS
jgi:5-hydroxyisourate hydrolase